MTQHTRPSGAEIRQRVFGEANGQPTPPGDPFLAPFFETAIEHVWGGVWNRPGLELKYRSLVVVSVLAALGQLDEIKPHIRGALNLGWTVDELREALLQVSGYAGFPAAHEALRVLSDRHTSLSFEVSVQQTEHPRPSNWAVGNTQTWDDPIRRYSAFKPPRRVV
jgi:4-carboxymuconolactone decarboxylase